MKKINLTIKVSDVDSYFSLPKSQRQKWGLYLAPHALPYSIESDVSAWDEFSERIRKEYPIQGWLREWALTSDNPIYRSFGKIKMFFSNIYYSTKRFLNPVASRYRKVCPRWKYVDVSEIIEESNFALILDFWYDEVQKGHIDWQGCEKSYNFYIWLKESVNWIESEKPRLQRIIDENFKNSFGDKLIFEKTLKLEQDIEDRNTEILKKMMEYRNHFWT